MPRFVNPIDDSQAYDYATIGGERNPGIIAQKGITGFKRVTSWDVKKGKGTKGGTMTLSQLPPAKGSIKFWLWLPEHFAAWDTSFRARFKYDPTKKTRQAIDIYHPALETVDVNSVVTDSLTPPEPEGEGLWSITVELSEYLPPPPKNITRTPSGSSSSSKGGGASGATSDPIADAQQAEIAALLKKAGEP